MNSNSPLNVEGDVNNSCHRQQWYNHLSERKKQVLSNDEDVFMAQALSTPCMEVIKNAYKNNIQAIDGRLYLDFHGNSLHQVGYSNPAVIKNIEKQMRALSFVPRRFTNPVAIKAAQKLINKTCSKDFKALFVPSGAVAVDLALKIARKATGKHKVISMWESFHGASLGSIAVGGEYAFKKDIGPLLPGTIKAIPYNSYNNLIDSDSPKEISKFCLDYIEYIIENEGDIGALIMEPIRATTVHIPPKSYFEQLKNICQEHEILLIFDEIPTALGRSGKFYVHQNFGIEPDILVLGKGLGGGIVPQAAILAKKSLDMAQDISLGHYTHEKPAIGSAAICATIDYIDDHRLIKRCNDLSEYVQKKAEQLKKDFRAIGDIRIQGLLITFELVKDRKTKEKASEMAEKVLYECLKNGLSFKVSSGNCMTWHPPLTISKSELSKAFEIFKSALTKYSS